MEQKKKIIIGIIIAIIVLIIIGIISINNQEKYTISFDTNGGAVMSNITLDKNTTIGDIEDPKREGYTFQYWTYEGKICKDTDKITKSMKLIAVWKADEDTKVEKYIIKFDADNNTKIIEQEVEEGNIVIKPSDPKKEGYKFKYWEKEGKEYDFSTKVKESLTLKAKWEKIIKYTVTFNSNGGSRVESQTITEGEKATRPTNPTRSGYTFNGWTLNGNAYDFNSKVINNITLVANWTKESSGNPNPEPPKPEKKKYTVTFNSNGGSTVGSQKITEGNTVTRPGNPTRSGYTFNGWLLNGKVYDFNTKVTSNITLIASWTEKPKVNYTVTFNSNGGSAVGSQTITEGNLVTRPTNPTRSGYTFNGWLLNGSAYNFNSPVTRNITLVASWTQKSYTITVTKVDEYSPDRILKVYENGTQINVSSIKYSDGVLLCNGSNTTVSFSEIEGESSFIVVLTDGTEVNARLS